MAMEAGNELKLSKASRAGTMSYGQPWWRGLTNNCVLPTSTDFGITSPFQEQINGIGGGFSLQDTGAPFNKEIHTSLIPQSDRDNAPQQARKIVSSSMPEHIGKRSNSQMGPIGNSIDPTYGGLGGFLAYTQQVNSEHYGIHQSRMALPLAMEEEPVYVNAKQYRGILRRRQIRARAELEKKVVKNKKPYLHESRHKHALRRARGAGGRFLNTKKVGEYNDNNLEEYDANERQASDTTFSDHISLNYSANASWQQESRVMMVSDKHKAELHSNDIHGLSATHHSLSSSSNNGRGEMTRNGFVSVK